MGKKRIYGKLFYLGSVSLGLFFSALGFLWKKGKPFRSCGNEPGEAGKRLVCFYLLAGIVLQLLISVVFTISGERIDYLLYGRYNEIFLPLTVVLGIMNLTEASKYFRKWLLFAGISYALDGIEVRLGVDYLENKAELDKMAETIIYTGPIDAYFNYSPGYLEYRSVRFENEILNKPNFQGNAAVNYTDRETPWTRIIEHKWFEFGKDENGNDLPKTVISREYSSEWKPGDEPYYPVNDAKNGLLYTEYRKLAEHEKNVIFGGRLGEYKYYDMDQVIAMALSCSSRMIP